MKLKAVSLLFAVIILCLPLVSSCQSPIANGGELTLTDSEGKTVQIPQNARVASAYGSFSECWLLSGGTLVGATDDAVSERGLELSSDVAIIGSVKSVDLERLISLAPDLVILSADLTAHRELALQLSDRGIATALFRVDTFDDYALMMKQFCAVNGGDDLYKKHVTDIKDAIYRVKDSLPRREQETDFLVMRAYSNGIKVKTDNIAEDIARDLGLLSVVDAFPSMLTDLSVEAIISADPDVILVLTMGDEKSAEQYLRGFFEDNPALAALSAVKNERLYILPKELFHYKPNNKWNESYEYLAKIIFPEALG